MYDTRMDRLTDRKSYVERWEEPMQQKKGDKYFQKHNYSPDT